MRRRLPRVVNMVAQAVAFPALFVGAPVSLCQGGKRHGWSGLVDRERRTSSVCFPLALAGHCFCGQCPATTEPLPEDGRSASPPTILLASGPYRFSRNPMYVGEAAIWAGWAVLFGRLPVATGLVAITVVQIGAVRVKERMLHGRWGDSYDSYRAWVPRWLKLPTVSRSS